MASVSVTYSFTNGTTADADEVNTNFTDIINGTSDGTKDFNIAALTCAGTATLNGSVTLGNSSSDDITFNGSLASTIPIKTTASFDIGSSTKGLQRIYLGSGSNTVGIGVNSSIGSNVTYQVPHTQGSAGDQILNAGSGNMVWQPNTFGFTSNIGLAAATTTNSGDSIKITGANGSALSSTNPGYVMLPSTTSGQLTAFSVTSDVTIDLTGTHWGFGTLGDLTDYVLHVLALNNNGSLVWGIAAESGRQIVLDTEDDTTQANISSFDKVLVNSALSADAQVIHVGYFKANFDDTGGAAEDLWAVQSGDGDLVITNGKVPLMTPWINYGPLTINGSSSNPTKATTTVTDTAYFRRIGDSMHLRYYYYHTDNTGAAAGTGTYLFVIPLALEIDTNKATDSTSTGLLYPVGTSTVAGASFVGVGMVKVWNATSLNIYVIEAGGPSSGAISSTYFAINQSAMAYGFDCIIPISGWDVF